jgi:hypothetical protein
MRFSYTLARIGSIAACLVLSACSQNESVQRDQRAGVEEHLLLSMPEQPVDYRQAVKPVLERRCVVCHGCYDAPCQLKLSSLDGLQRGASKEKVYDGTRITGSEPTRLGVDAQTPAQWRKKGFFPVLDTDADTPRDRLQDSVIYQLLRLKQQYPQPRNGLLSDDFDLGLDREQVCSKRDEFEDYAREHPRWGMPYAMPNLDDDEYSTLVYWLAQGAPAATPEPLPASSLEQVEEWEAFFNGGDLKQQLVSRYLYEHLFIGHLHLAGAGPREFFRLVRSTTPPGQPIEEIPTLRPYDDPGKVPFYYRLRPYRASIVAKNHVVYELSPGRMARYRALFLQPDYRVDSLPGYDVKTAANPFKAFAAIPPVSRYRFMLDDARFFIEGFIKGPVCRGQIALNVIEDNFWVFFFDPDHNLQTLDQDFLARQSDELEMPNERGDTFRLLAAYTKYWRQLTGYMNARQAYFARLPEHPLDEAVNIIWNGYGENPNAALTVFRHFDSASVVFGLAGDYPETAWIIDYPVFERIHYLLVAGFNVYGNVGHQLNTRLYMDFLRMEGENHFLAFLPVSDRKRIRDSWYAGLRSDLDKLLDEPSEWLNVEVVTGYHSNDPQRELYQAIEKRLGPVSGGPDYINRCPDSPCRFPATNNAEASADRIMARVAATRGADLDVVPDLSFLRVRRDHGAQPDLAYTLIHNKAYTNISSMFADASNDDQRDMDNDTLTVLKGLHGAYPNFFFEIDLQELEGFTREYSGIHSTADHARFVEHYGIRRTDQRFWEVADWFQDTSADTAPKRHGLFDLNRYRNH